MSKSNDVFEFEGQKYVKSKRDSSEVKVGDVIRIREDIPAAEFWPNCDRNCLGTIKIVWMIYSDGDIEFKGHSGIWREDYFEILEPASKTNPRPHAELIKQWADDDSLEIEYLAPDNSDWQYASPKPLWNKTFKYRVKPKTVPAWRVLYEFDGGFDLTFGSYKSEEEFNNNMKNGEKFIKFILETEKQVQV
jgi:hypothetical protein